MTPTDAIDPALPDGSRIEEFSARYGNDYVLLAFLLLLPLVVGGALVMGYPEISKAIFIAGALAVSAAGALAWVFVAKIAVTEWGSFIDVANRRIVCWEGPSPAARTVIDIGAIAKVVIVRDPHNRCEIYLDSRNDERLQLRARCVRDSCAWGQSLSAAFPELAVEETDWSTFHGRPWLTGD